MLGNNTVERVVTMGNDIRDWRARASGMEVTAADVLLNRRFGDYVSRLGKDVLQMVSSVVEDEDVVVARREAKKKAIEAKMRLQRKDVKVASMESGAESSKMDEEWDTSAWSDEMVEDSVSVLFEVFYDQVTRKDEFRKKRASAMLEKLVNRHFIAEAYVRKNVPLLVGLAANRFIRGGQSCGLLDLLFILHSARVKYVPELSENNFTGRATEMALLEARSAVLMMQHMVRARTARRNAKLRGESANGLISSFGSAEETEILSESNIEGRTLLLKTRWVNMHVWQSKADRNTPIGFRGPVHIRANYMILIMEIMLTLVSEAACTMAQCNREELVRCNGCVLFAQMLGVPHGPYAAISAQIMSHVSKIACSLAPIMHSGYIRSGMRCIHYFQQTGKMAWAVVGNRTLAVSLTPPSSGVPTAAQLAMETARIAFLDILAMLVNSSTHAAAIHRARNGFDCQTPQNGTIESNDYKFTLYSSSSQLTEAHLKALFGNRFVLNPLMNFLKTVTNLHITRGSLRVLYNLACSDCFNAVLGEVVACGGKNLLCIVELLEEADSTISSLALGLLLQLCTQQPGRDGLLASYYASVLVPRAKCSSVYTRRPYLRAVLATVSAMRHGDRRSYNPVEMPFLLADAESVRKLVYLDLLKSLKHPPLEEADALSIADLVVRPFNKVLSLKVAQNASQLGSEGVKNVCDFLCHPTEDQFFASLPWDESGAGCVILDGLSRHQETCRMIVSSSTIRYLSHCLYWGRMVIKDGPPLADARLLILLKGITSASMALGNLCKAAIGTPELTDAIIAVFQEVDVVFATTYFVNTLSQNHPLVEEAIKSIQIKAGRSTLVFFDSYIRMIIAAKHLGGKQRQAILLETQDVGKAITSLLLSIKRVHGETLYFPKLLNGICTFLAALLSERSIVEVAISRWKIVLSMREHLPLPLSALGEHGVDDPLYRQGLGIMPASFFDICTSICALEKGKAACLVDGFLRRAIEKVVLLASRLEPPHELLRWTLSLSRIHVDTLAGQEYSLDLLSTPHARFTPSVARQEVAAALRVVACCASFANAQFGSANDVILDPEFDFVHVCKSFISVEEAPRCDPVIVAAIQVLGGLSADIFRVAPLFEELDILGLLARQMTYVPMLPQDAVKSCLDVANNMATTGSHYVIDQLRKLREPVLKVGRVMPQLAKVVGETSWNITQTFIKFERSAAATATTLGTMGSFGRQQVVSTQSMSHDEESSVFDNDRILREQLQKLYSAAGLEEEAERLSPSKDKSPGSARQTFPSPVHSASPLASPASPKGRLVLESLNHSPEKEMLGSLSLPSTSASSPSVKPGIKLLSPISRSKLGGSSSLASPITSPNIFSGPSRKQLQKSSPKKNTGSPLAIMSTDQIDELRFTRPTL